MEQLSKLEFIAHTLYVNELKDKGFTEESWAQMSKPMKLLYRNIAEQVFKTWREKQWEEQKKLKKNDLEK